MCLQLIEKELMASNGKNEFALYMKGLIKRQTGKIEESIQLFQAAAYLNPADVNVLKQLARSTFLIGQVQQALELYQAAEELSARGQPDWGILHAKGECYMALGDVPAAILSFREALTVQRKDRTYLALAKAYIALDDLAAAAAVYTEGIEYDNESVELLTGLGKLFMRQYPDSAHRAFDMFGTSLAHNPRHADTLLAAAHIMQTCGELDAALIKYRVVAAQHPDSPELWNNIGCCMLAKNRIVAAAACFRRAQHLDPFSWRASFNLGLVDLHMQHYASAFTRFSAAINLKPDWAAAYVYLAVTLSRLDDIDNAVITFEKAISMSPKDPLAYLNYAAALSHHKIKPERAAELMKEFYKVWSTLSVETRREFAIDDVLAKLRAATGVTGPSSGAGSGAGSASGPTSSTGTQSTTSPQSQSPRLSPATAMGVSTTSPTNTPSLDPSVSQAEPTATGSSATPVPVPPRPAPRPPPPVPVPAKPLRPLPNPPSEDKR